MPDLHEILGYEVLSTLGYGARSTIYGVRDDDLNMYALKRVVKSSPSDQRFIDQAVLEYNVSREFDHPLLRKSLRLFKLRQVIRVSEVYVLLEYVDGVTLEKYQPEDIGRLIDVCTQIATGLQVMHSHGMIHADMKPNNVMVTKEHKVKIIDYGQSCKSGMIKDRIQGTPDYIAPEQVRRRNITPATDVFNLGATMYWMLTGRHVQTLIPRRRRRRGRPGEMKVEIKEDSSTRSRTVPPIEVNPDMPPALSSLVVECVQHDPQDRPQNMQQVLDRLQMAVGQAERMPSVAAEEEDSTSDKDSSDTDVFTAQPVR